LAAKGRCDFLWIGIAAPDPIGLQRHRDTQREKPGNNPLSYFERLSIITSALVDAGVRRSDFGFIPFPIEIPERLPNYLPTRIPCFTTICEPWNREKIRILSDLGYTVEILYERTAKAISGAEIRADLLRGGNAWTTLVPRSTARHVIEYDMRARLRHLHEGEG